VELYNTLTRRKETFSPREPGKVSMYVCGPTTYNYIHLGNARPLVFFDTVRRYFTYRGYLVDYVQNFTDIDDKIINRAGEEGEDPLALAQKYINEYFRDADALNVRRADIHPRVSGHMPEIIEMIDALIKNGNAYVVEGDIYFAVHSFSAYGRLSGRSLDDLRAGARVEVDPRKRDPLDFALWKAAKPGEPFWESPWSPGRPGWHIECSAMSLKYLGTGFDIHGGGFDLIFPHHENEIAQSEAATGKSFARYWLHNGFITVNEEKMSKSLGNFFLVRDILARFPPETVRFYLLSTHYRSPLDFDDQKLESAGRGLERIKTSIRLLAETLARPEDGRASAECKNLPPVLEELRDSFEKAMDDDFNAALATSVLFDLAREVNTCVQRLGPALAPSDRDVLLKAKGLFKAFNEVLGIFKVHGNGEMLLEGMPSPGSDLVDGLLGLIIGLRREARGRKDWAVADRIRDDLKNLGIIIEDTPQGVRWKKQG